MNSITAETSRDPELEELQDLALKESCDNPDEAMLSRTTHVALKRVSDIVRRVIDEAEMAYFLGGDTLPAHHMPDIYDRFVCGQLITYLEHKSLLDFLRNQTYQGMAKDIVSKLKFVQWDENQEFFDQYMKDRDGKIDPTKLIQYIIEQIESYALVLNESEENVQELGRIEWLGTYYTYEDVRDQGGHEWKNLAFVSQDGKMRRYGYRFATAQLLDNWLVFWVTREISENQPVWNIFENIEGNLTNIYSEPWIISLDERWGGMMISTSGDWKKWLLKEITPEEENRFVVEGIEETRKHRKIVELMPTTHSQISIDEGFILTNSDLSGSDCNFNWVHIYDPSVKEHDSNSWYFRIKTLLPTIRCVELRSNGYVFAEKDGNVNVHRYNPENKELPVIHELQWILSDEEALEGLIQWEITYLQFVDKRKGLYILDPKTGEVRRLVSIELREWVDNVDIDTCQDRLKLEYMIKKWEKESWKTKEFWFHNWELYYLTWFNNFKSEMRDEPFNKNNFRVMQVYLTKWKWSVIRL